MQVTTDAEAYAVYKQGFKPIPVAKKDNKKAKNDKFCQHCKIKRHSIDQCFKIHGYPDWYKEKYGTKTAAQVATSEYHTNKNISEQDSPLAIIEEQNDAQSTNTALISVVCQEVLKALKCQGGGSGNAAAGPIPSAFAGKSIVASSII